jgi:hypothetical protein
MRPRRMVAVQPLQGWRNMLASYPGAALRWPLASMKTRCWSSAVLVHFMAFPPCSRTIEYCKREGEVSRCDPILLSEHRR